MATTILYEREVFSLSITATKTLVDEVDEQLTVNFPEEIGKTPLLARMMDKYGNLACPFYYGRQLAQTYNLVNLSEGERSSASFAGDISLNDTQRALVTDLSDCLATEGCAMISAFTGAGKTRIGVYLAQQCQVVTVILIANKVLIGQWVNEFGKQTDAIIRVVGLDGDQYYCQNQLLSECPAYYQVVIVMNERIDRLEDDLFLDTGLLIIDEAHRFCTNKRIAAVLSFQPQKLLLCTATPHRDDGCTKFLEFLVGPHVLWAYRDGHTRARILQTPFRPILERQFNGRLDWTTAKESLYYNEERNQLIVNEIRQAVEAGERVLVMVDEIDHGNLLSNMVEDELGYSVSTLFGKVNKNRKRARDIPARKRGPYYPAQVIVASHNKAGEGFDEANYVSPEICAAGFPPISHQILVFSMAQVYCLIQFTGRIRAKERVLTYLLDGGGKNGTLKKHCDSFLRALQTADRTIERYLVANHGVVLIGTEHKKAEVPETTVL